MVLRLRGSQQAANREGMPRSRGLFARYTANQRPDRPTRGEGAIDGSREQNHTTSPVGFFSRVRANSLRRVPSTPTCPSRPAGPAIHRRAQVATLPLPAPEALSDSGTHRRLLRDLVVSEIALPLRPGASCSPNPPRAPSSTIIAPPGVRYHPAYSQPHRGAPPESPMMGPRRPDGWLFFSLALRPALPVSRTFVH